MEKLGRVTDKSQTVEKNDTSDPKARENVSPLKSARYWIPMKSVGKQAVGDRRGILDTDEKHGKTSSRRQARYTWYQWKARENK